MYVSSSSEGNGADLSVGGLIELRVDAVVDAIAAADSTASVLLRGLIERIKEAK